MITALAIAQRWPVATWGSLYERALYQARRLSDFEARSDGALVVARTRSDLAAALEARANGRPVVTALFGIEGAHPLEGELGRLDSLFEAGLRVVGLTHFFDNRIGGSLHGLSHAGLSDFGRSVVARAGELGMTIDVAHASPRAVRDVLSMSQRPVILSHGGFASVCDTARNLDDELMREIAAHGGLIGVGFWDGAVCDTTPVGVARAIAAGIELVGVDHIALGSDYDGATEVRFDSSEQVALTQALLDAGVGEGAIRQVMGDNAIGFFLDQLPE
jgi:microsomal dipeptidase-like Zn-dependent dipeptidase